MRLEYLCLSSLLFTSYENRCSAESSGSPPACLWFMVKGKGKAPVLSLSTTRGGVLGEWRYSSTHYLTSALHGGEWSVSRPGRFTPKERAPCTHWIGDYVGPRARLDAVVKRKIPSPRRESNPRNPIVQPVAQHYTDWAITVLLWFKTVAKADGFPGPF
jgi:hypothetical protein